MTTNLVNGSEARSALSVSLGQRENRHTIADRMEALAIELRSMADCETETVPTEGTLVALAGKIYAARRKVDEVFGMQGFSVTSGWDILLDLYMAKAQNKEISVTSACIGAACPSTTALRWIHALEKMNLIIRKPDAEDRRRFILGLTEGGKVKIDRALAMHL